MRFDRMIELEYLPEGATEWVPVLRMHADVNKAVGKEYLGGGAIQSQETLRFTVRYGAVVAAIRRETQRYRVRFGGGIYKLQDYDDFEERHRTVKLTGVSYRG